MLANHSGSVGGLVSLFWLFVICAMAFFFGTLAIDALKANATSQNVPQVQVSDHGLEKHVEAKDLQDACNRDGPYQVWKDKTEKGKFYFICRVGETFGVIPVISTASGLVAKTAFMPSNSAGNGTMNAVRFYLEAFATRYSGKVQ